MKIVYVSLKVRQTINWARHITSQNYARPMLSQRAVATVSLLNANRSPRFVNMAPALKSGLEISVDMHKHLSIIGIAR